MKVRTRIQWCSAFLLVFCLTSCQVKRPKEVLPDAKMENVLYDYHIAKAMGEEVSYKESYKRLLYIESVFKKHDITKADFDSSMVWYARNPEVLAKIYEKVNQRLKSEKESISNLIAIRDNKPKESLPGDSIDVWVWQHIYQLTGMPLDNKVIFTLPSDTNFHDRDTLRWNVRFRFPSGLPDSIHAPLMAMQILYENDSTVNAIQKVKSIGVETVSLSADTLGEIKEIRGFIYYPMQDVSRPLLIDNISLMRYHATDSLIIAPKDSLQQTAADKAKRETDELKSTKPIKSSEIRELDGDINRRHESPRPRPSALRETEMLRKVDKEEIKR